MLWEDGMVNPNRITFFLLCEFRVFADPSLPLSNFQLVLSLLLIFPHNDLRVCLHLSISSSCPHCHLRGDGVQSLCWQSSCHDSNFSLQKTCSRANQQINRMLTYSTSKLALAYSWIYYLTPYYTRFALPCMLLYSKLLRKQKDSMRATKVRQEVGQAVCLLLSYGLNEQARTTRHAQLHVCQNSSKQVSLLSLSLWSS